MDLIMEPLLMKAQGLLQYLTSIKKTKKTHRQVSVLYRVKSMTIKLAFTAFLP